MRYKVSAMKKYNILKEAALALILIPGVALIVFANAPELPSSRPIMPGSSGAEIRAYLIENLFPIAFLSHPCSYAY